MVEKVIINEIPDVSRVHFGLIAAHKKSHGTDIHHASITSSFFTVDWHEPKMVEKL